MTTTRQELILATIRTAVPSAVGWLLAQLIARIPVVDDVIRQIDVVLAESAPGFTVRVVLNAAAVALVVAVYYWAVRQLGRRWPLVERFLLGSARQPTYIDARSSTTVPVITTLPDPATSTRSAYQDALEKSEEG